jgi:Flavin reductase like domain
LGSRQGCGGKRVEVENARGSKIHHRDRDFLRCARAGAEPEFGTHGFEGFEHDLDLVLVSSAYRGATNIMTMGWHMVMGFDPSLIGCYIWDQNHSFEMIRKSRECVINRIVIDSQNIRNTRYERLGACLSIRRILLAKEVRVGFFWPHEQDIPCVEDR